MRSFLLCTCFVLGSIASAGASPWRVVEGPEGATQGVWDITVSGSDASGNADMFDGRGQKISYLLSGSISGAVYDLQRTSSSDGATCRYIGELQSDGKIAGTSQCPDGLGVWIVDTAWQ